MPGGIDPHTHMQLPFMGTVGQRRFLLWHRGRARRWHDDDHRLRHPQSEATDHGSAQAMARVGREVRGRLFFHVAITWWDESVRKDMETLVRDHGVNSFKHFMAYKNAIMCDDETLVNSFSTALSLGAIVTAHAENGDLVFKLQDEIYKRGITGPEGHPLSRPPEVEGEAANRAIRIAEVLKVPIYLVHVSSRQALEAIARARNEGQRVFGEVLADICAGRFVYRDRTSRAAAHVMSPVPRPEHQGGSVARLQSESATPPRITARSGGTKGCGKDDFARFPRYRGN
jgi:dihydropyrimidinase